MALAALVVLLAIARGDAARASHSEDVMEEASAECKFVKTGSADRGAALGELQIWTPTTTCSVSVPALNKWGEYGLSNAGDSGYCTGPDFNAVNVHIAPHYQHHPGWFWLNSVAFWHPRKEITGVELDGKLLDNPARSVLQSVKCPIQEGSSEDIIQTDEQEPYTSEAPASGGVVDADTVERMEKLGGSGDLPVRSASGGVVNADTVETTEQLGGSADHLVRSASGDVVDANGAEMERLDGEDGSDSWAGSSEDLPGAVATVKGGQHEGKRVIISKPMPGEPGNFIAVVGEDGKGDQITVSSGDLTVDEEATQKLRALVRSLELQVAEVCAAKEFDTSTRNGRINLDTCCNYSPEGCRTVLEGKGDRRIAGCVNNCIRKGGGILKKKHIDM